jgi:hypothetical protein
MIQQLPTRQAKRHLSEDHWIPLSDLMTGLMMVFMLIAIMFMTQVQAEAQKTEELKKTRRGASRENAPDRGDL